MDLATRSQWLRRITKKYQNPDRTYKDVDDTLTHFSPSLSLKTDAYTYNDGSSKILLCIHGTIPISYRSINYNIPVAFWIPSDYPSSPPMVFVVPTQNMRVRSGPHVDYSGKCILPYLRFWRAESSSIIELCQILQNLFSNNPPLYTLPNVSPNPTPHPSDRPLQPGPPQATGAIPSPVLQAYRPKSPTPPPLPPPPYQLGQVVADPNRPRSQSGTLPAPAGPGVRYGSSLPSPSVISPPSSSSSSSTQSNQITLVDAPPPLIVPPRPLPPNNSELVNLQVMVFDKIGRHWYEYHDKNHREFDKDMVLSRMLQDSEARVENEKQQLTETLNALKEKINFLQQKCEEVDKVIEQANARPEVSVDDILCGTTVVYNQLSVILGRRGLFELVAEDNAIEDAIYYLGRALNSEKIDLNTYMKNIRTLAREQFTRRALIQKIRKQAGLDL